MNWDSIKYIFQIPVEWYRKIHNRVFNAYGTNFLTVREGFYGGTEIGIDSDGFAAEVQRVSGTVKSVDDVEPDEDGNVELNAVTTDTEQTITANKTFQDASIGFSTDTQSSTIDLGDVSAGVSSGANQVTIEAVNGNNDSGITVSVDGSGTTKQLLVNEPARLYSQGDDNQIASRGYVRLSFARASHTHGNISNDGKITQGSGTSTPDYYIAADSNGNLYRQSVSSLPTPTPSISTGDITDWNTATADFVTTSDLQDYVTTNDLTTTLGDYVTTNDLSTTLNDYVTTSDLGEYLEESDFPNGFLTAASNGKNVSNISVVTDVVWTGTVLQKKYRTMTFTNGLLTSCSNEMTATIDTPTIVTWR